MTTYDKTRLKQIAKERLREMDFIQYMDLGIMDDGNIYQSKSQKNRENALESWIKEDTDLGSQMLHDIQVYAELNGCNL